MKVGDSATENRTTGRQTLHKDIGIQVTNPRSLWLCNDYCFHYTMIEKWKMFSTNKLTGSILSKFMVLDTPLFSTGTDTDGAFLCTRCPLLDSGDGNGGSGGRGFW